MLDLQELSQTAVTNEQNTPENSQEITSGVWIRQN